MTRKEATEFLETALTSLDNVAGCLDEVSEHLIDEEGATSKSANLASTVLEDVDSLERLVILLKEKITVSLKN